MLKSTFIRINLRDWKCYICRYTNFAKHESLACQRCCQRCGKLTHPSTLEVGGRPVGDSDGGGQTQWNNAGSTHFPLPAFGVPFPGKGKGYWGK